MIRARFQRRQGLAYTEPQEAASNGQQDLFARSERA